MSEHSRTPLAAADHGSSAIHTPRELVTIQRWMQGVITHPEGIVAGIADAATQQEIAITPEQVEQVILPSRNQSSVERLAVYGNSYFARLLECLRSMFPVLTQTLGEEAFDAFAFAFLQEFPSQSYTLDRLADHFADFLEQTRPEQPAELELVACQSTSQVSPHWPDFVIDLARFETSIEQVFDGPGGEDLPQLAAERVAAIAPEHWPRTRLVPTPSLRLMEFKFPLNDYYTEMRANQEPPLPTPSPSYLAFWRRNYVVRRMAITREQYELLAAILAGHTFSETLAAAAAVTEDFDAFAAALAGWFREWTAAGFFLNVELRYLSH